MEVRLKELLAERGITTAEFSRRIGISSSFFFSKNEKKPSLRMLATYAAALEVPVWELMYDCGVPAVKKKQDQDVDEVSSVVIKCPHCNSDVNAKIILGKTAKNMLPSDIKKEQKMAEYSLLFKSDEQPEVEEEEKLDVVIPTLRIKEILEEKKMSQQDLANKLKMSKSNMSHALSGKCTMTMAIMDRIAKGLGVEPYELVASKEEVEEERQRRLDCNEIESFFESDFVKKCPFCGYGIKMSITVS